MHHANLIIGEKNWGMAHIPLCDRESCSDVIVYNSERMSIDDARALILNAGMRPVERTYRSFIIQTDQILHDAQNALLKLFEEPNVHTIFYLILPREEILIPTLRSRLSIIAKEYANDAYDAFTIFKKLSYAERIEEIGNRIKKEDAGWMKEIVEGFTQYAHESKNPEHIQNALMLGEYFYTNGSAKKMLLEHTALSF